MTWGRVLSLSEANLFTVVMMPVFPGCVNAPLRLHELKQMFSVPTPSAQQQTGSYAFCILLGDEGGQVNRWFPGLGKEGE